MTLFLDKNARVVEPLLNESDPLPPDDRVRSKPAQSLEMLYRAQAPRLLRMFLRRGQREESQDLVHDSFVRIAGAFTGSEAIERPEAYLTTVATNVLRNRARAAYHRTMIVQDPDLAETGSVDITTNLEARDMLNRLHAAMAKLSPKTREIFMAHRLDGQTYAEIAERLGLGIKGVEWHMSKALAVVHKAAGRR